MILDSRIAYNLYRLKGGTVIVKLKTLCIISGISAAVTLLIKDHVTINGYGISGFHIIFYIVSLVLLKFAYSSYKKKPDAQKKKWLYYTIAVVFLSIILRYIGLVLFAMFGWI